MHVHCPQTEEEFTWTYIGTGLIVRAGLSGPKQTCCACKAGLQSQLGYDLNTMMSNACSTLCADQKSKLTEHQGLCQAFAALVMASAQLNRHVSYLACKHAGTQRGGWQLL